MKVERNFLITGATSCLGKAIANKIAAKYLSDCRMLLISRSFSKDLDGITDENIKYVHGVDLLSQSSEHNISDVVEDFFDKPFTLIHCAGDFWYHEPFLEVSSERAMLMMGSHYGTLYNVLQSVLPRMIKRGGGKILTFGCNATPYNYPNMLPFTAAKAAVDATIKCIAHEYADKNIVANSIALSSLQTQQNLDSKPFGDYEHYLNLEELADTILEISQFTNNLVNGNVISCYKYSDTYYNQGYFERIKHSDK